jgi:hypothetical protein
LTWDRLHPLPWTSIWRHHRRLRPLQRQLLVVHHHRRRPWSSGPLLLAVDNHLATSTPRADVSSSLATAQTGWPHLPSPMGGPNGPRSGQWRLPPHRPVGGEDGGSARPLRGHRSGTRVPGMVSHDADRHQRGPLGAGASPRSAWRGSLVGPSGIGAPVLPGGGSTRMDPRRGSSSRGALGAAQRPGVARQAWHSARPSRRLGAPQRQGALTALLGGRIRGHGHHARAGAWHSRRGSTFGDGAPGTRSRRTGRSLPSGASSWRVCCIQGVHGSEAQRGAQARRPQARRRRPGGHDLVAAAAERLGRLGFLLKP